MSCNDFDDVVESLLGEFIVARRGAGGVAYYPLDEIYEREFDALLRHRARMCAEREEEEYERFVQHTRNGVRT